MWFDYELIKCEKIVTGSLDPFSPHSSWLSQQWNVHALDIFEKFSTREIFKYGQSRVIPPSRWKPNSSGAMEFPNQSHYDDEKCE